MEADEVHVASRHVWEHGAGEGWRGVEAVRGSGARGEIELGGFEPDHPQGRRRARGFGWSPGRVVVRRQLRRGVEGHMKDAPQVYALVLLEGVRGDNLVRVRWIRQAARHEVESRPSLGGKNHDTEIRGVEWVPTRARGLAVVGAESHC